MIILIAGGTHTGKTLLAQKLLEKHGYPYLSIDHLKMALIKTGLCRLAPESDEQELTACLWPIVREMAVTVLENRQNLIIEGCYIPFDYQRWFSDEQLRHLRYICLIFSESYIEKYYDDIMRQANVIEIRKHDDELISREDLIRENTRNLNRCLEYGLDHLLIDGSYEVSWDIFGQ